MTVLLQLLVTWGAALCAWLVISALVSIPTALLWNWLMPNLFGLPEIGIVQAFGLLVLSALLFGSRKVDVQTDE